MGQWLLNSKKPKRVGFKKTKKARCLQAGGPMFASPNVFLCYICNIEYIIKIYYNIIQFGVGHFGAYKLATEAKIFGFYEMKTEIKPHQN